MAKQKSKWHTLPWNTEQYLKEMEQGIDKRMHIIALFIRMKNYHFDNLEQMQFFISRNNGVAKRLRCFSLDKIKITLQHLIETADYKISLETIEKYIFEDIQTLKKEEPILTLSTGEKIYDIKRLQELESGNKIYYDKDRWIERIN